MHEVIPYMDILTEHLARFKDDRVLHPVVHAASERGIEVINRYYSKTDQSVVYRIAMSASCDLPSIKDSELTLSILVLHPAYKTQYFTEHDWLPDWTEEALRLVREEWTKYYKPELTIKVEDNGEARDSESPAPSQSSVAGRQRPGHLSARATFDVSFIFFSPPCDSISDHCYLTEHSEDVCVHGASRIHQGCTGRIPCDAPHEVHHRSNRLLGASPPGVQE